MSKTTKPHVVARLTLAQPKNMKMIVEVHAGASFHEFYHWYRQEGRKRKVFLRTSDRNDGIKPHWRAPFEMPGLDVVAARVTSFNKTVTGVTLKVLRKRAYHALLTCPAEELGNGLPHAQRWGLDTKPRWARRDQGIPVHLPADYIPLQKRMDILTGVTR